MATLHMVFTESGLASCLAIHGEQDVVVLLGNAVYASEAAEFAALREDCSLRGVKHPQQIEMDELVELTAVHSPIVSWSN